MEDKESHGEKTEAPTVHRLKKSKEEGQTPRFASVSMLTGLLGGMAGLGLSWVVFKGQIETGFMRGLMVTQQVNWRDKSMGDYLFDSALSIMKSLLPFFMTISITSLLAVYFTSGFSWSWHRVRLNLNRCNPIKGWQQWMGRDAWVNFAFACLKCLSVVGVFVGLIKTEWLPVLRFGQYGVNTGFYQAIHWCFMTALILISPLIVWIVLEVIYQKWSFLEKMKMSKQDIKEEIKKEEGRPEIKMKIKQARHYRSQ